MTADVKIPRNLLYSEIPFESASTLLLKGFFRELELLVLTVLPEKLEISILKRIAVFVKTELFDRANVGTVGQHHVLQIKRYYFAREPGHHYVEMDSKLIAVYFISLRVNS